MATNIRVIDPKKDRLRAPRYHLIRSVKNALKNGEVAGYALVVWDREGYCASYVRTSERVSQRILPAIAHDALQQHTVLDMLEDSSVDYPPDPPKEGA